MVSEYLSALSRESRAIISLRFCHTWDAAITDTPLPYSLSGSRLVPSPSSASFQSPNSTRMQPVRGSVLSNSQFMIRSM